MAVGRPEGSRATPQALMRKAQADSARLGAMAKRLQMEDLKKIQAIREANNPVSPDAFDIINKLLPMIKSHDDTVLNIGKQLTVKGAASDEPPSATAEAVLSELTKGKQ